jgi:2-aminoethylphosphonate-pyruvate transaminase
MASSSFRLSSPYFHSAIDMAGLEIDALASSANKCLEGGPGLAFVIAKKALIWTSRNNSQSLSLDLYGQYLSLYEDGGKFRFTSPTHVLLVLRQALYECRKEGGQPERYQRYRKNHELLTWGLAKLGIRSIVAPENQSCIITTFDLGSLDFSGLYNALKSEGFLIYPGKLTTAPTFRLSNIGNLYPSDIEAFIQAVSRYLTSQPLSVKSMKAS